jgi:hypothetical protein
VAAAATPNSRRWAMVNSLKRSMLERLDFVMMGMQIVEVAPKRCDGEVNPGATRQLRILAEVSAESAQHPQLAPARLVLVIATSSQKSHLAQSDA